MTREETIEAILKAARKPMPPVVQGMHGGFVYLSPNGTTYSPKFFKTREDAVTWMAEARAQEDEDFRASMNTMTEERLADQAAFWLRPTSKGGTRK